MIFQSWDNVYRPQEQILHDISQKKFWWQDPFKSRYFKKIVCKDLDNYVRLSKVSLRQLLKKVKDNCIKYSKIVVYDSLRMLSKII